MNNNIKNAIKIGALLGLNGMFVFGLGCTKKEAEVPQLQEEQVDMKKTKTPSNQTHCQVVEKIFVGKDGEPTKQNELYLRCSVQDYFIKFCESEVSNKDVAGYLDGGITVEMEVRDGAWDTCDGLPIQSRVGTYVVIKKIFK